MATLHGEGLFLQQTFISTLALNEISPNLKDMLWQLEAKVHAKIITLF